MPEEKEPTQNEPQSQQSTPQQAPDIGAQVRSILSEMAKSGELLGGGDETSESGQGVASSPSPSFDLRGAIREALAEERAEGEQERERTSLKERLDRLENPPKKRQWGKPWSPFGS